MNLVLNILSFFMTIVLAICELFRTLFGTNSRITTSESVDLSEDVSRRYDENFARAFGLGFAKEQAYNEAKSDRSSAIKAAKLDTRLLEAEVFLSRCFEKLAEEQAKILSDASVGDFTDTNVSEFQSKLKLANRLTIFQANTRFGNRATDAALEKLGRGAVKFRVNNGCR